MTVAITRTEHTAAALRRQARQATGAALAIPRRDVSEADRGVCWRSPSGGFATVCFAVGARRALALPDADAMTLHVEPGGSPDPAEISRRIAPGAHAVLGAGWHNTGGRLRVPETITLLRLPPDSPELNPVETVWERLRASKLSSQQAQHQRVRHRQHHRGPLLRRLEPARRNTEPHPIRRSRALNQNGQSVGPSV